LVGIYNVVFAVGHWKLKEEAMDYTLRITSFERVYGPVLKDTKK
jgi:hypothetical protein